MIELNASLPKISFPTDDIIRESDKPSLKTNLNNSKQNSTQAKLPLNENIMNFDKTLSDLTFGKYQIKIYLIMGFLAFTEGSQIMSFTLLIPFLKQKWGISDFLNNIQISLIFLSLFFGSLVSGKFADKYGRKLPMIYTSGLMVLISFISAFSPNITFLIIIRVMLGFLVGFFAPLGATILTELTPAQVRGRFMALIQLSISFGQVYGILMAKLFISEDLKTGNWRILTIFCTFPGTIAFILSIFFLKESPRHELILGKYESAFDIIDYMNKQNGQKNFIELEEFEKNKLINWSKELRKDVIDGDDSISVKNLLKQKKKKITLLLWFNWFTSSFVYYGIVIFMPDTIKNLDLENSKNKKAADISKILISTVTEIFAVILAATLIDLKHFGRKNSMVIFYSLSVFSLLMVFTGKDTYIIWATVAKIFIAMTMIFCFQYTTEIYPTKFRTTGIGFASGVGRIGTIFMPIFYFALEKESILTPFFAFSLLSFFAAFASFKLPFDTAGKDLDSLTVE